MPFQMKRDDFLQIPDSLSISMYVMNKKKLTAAGWK